MNPISNFLRTLRQQSPSLVLSSAPRTSSRRQKTDEEIIQEGREEAQKELEAQQEAQAKADKAAAEAAKRAQNNAREAAWRAEKRPMYVDADGVIQPVQPDAVWQQQKQDNEAKKQADLEAKRQKEVLAEQKAADSKLRQQMNAGTAASRAAIGGVDDQIKTATSEAELKAMEKRQAKQRAERQIKEIEDRLENDLTMTPEQRTSAEQGMAALKQQASALQVDLDGAETSVIDRKKQELAWEKERQRMQREVQQFEAGIPLMKAPEGQGLSRGQGVKAGQETPVAGVGERPEIIVPGTPEARQKARERRYVQSVRDIELSTTLTDEQRKAALATVEKRFRDPKGYEQELVTSVQALSDEELAQMVETLDYEVPNTLAEIQTKGAIVDDLEAQHQARVQRLLAAREQVLQNGVSMTDSVTLTLPSGEQQMWPAKLAESYMSAEKRHALALQQAGYDDLMQDVEEHNLEASKAQAAQAEMARRREMQMQAAEEEKQATFRVMSITGQSGTVADMTALEKSAQARIKSIEQAHAEGSPQRKAAMQAVLDDVKAQEQGIRAKAAKQAESGAKLYDMYRDFGVSDWKAEKDFVRLKQEAQKMGLNDKDALYWMDYYQQADWSKPRGGTPQRDGYQRLGDEIHRGVAAIVEDAPLEEAEQARVLPDGQITVNPVFHGDAAKYAAAVKAAAGSKEAKAAAMKAFPALEEAWGEQQLETLQGEAFVPALQDFEQWRESKLRSNPDFSRKTMAAQAVEFLKMSKDRPWIAKLIETGVRRLAQGTGAAIGGVLGAGGLVTGVLPRGLDQGLNLSENLSTAGAAWTATGQKFGQANRIKGNESDLGLRAIGQTVELLPQIATMIAGAGVAGGSLKGVAALSAAQTAGAQYADTYATLRKKGASHEDAWAQSAPYAVASGLVTATLTAAGGARGIEALAVKPKEMKAVMNAAWKQAYPKLAKTLGIGYGAVSEIAEELPDELFSQISEAMAANRGADVSKIVGDFIASSPELMLAVGAMGAGGELMGGDQPAAGAVTKPTQAAKQPEVKAAAAAAVEAYADPQKSPEAVAVTKARAGALLKIAQGAKLEDLNEAELNGVGFARDMQTGEMKPGYYTNDPKTGALVWKSGETPPNQRHVYSVPDAQGKPQLVIPQASIDRLKQVMPEVAEAIKLDEAARVAQIKGGAVKPSQGAGQEVKAEAESPEIAAAWEELIKAKDQLSKTTDPAEQADLNRRIEAAKQIIKPSPKMGVVEATPDRGVSPKVGAVAATGAMDTAESGSRSRGMGTPVGGDSAASPAGVSPAESQGQEALSLPEEERAEQLAFELGRRGLDEQQAGVAARLVVKRMGVNPDGYAVQMAGTDFDDAMTELGWVRGTGKKWVLAVPERWEAATAEAVGSGLPSSAVVGDGLSKPVEAPANVAPQSQPAATTTPQPSKVGYDTGKLTPVETPELIQSKVWYQAKVAAMDGFIREFAKGRSKQTEAAVKSMQALERLIDTKFGRLFDRIAIGEAQDGGGLGAMMGRDGQTVLVISPAAFIRFGARTDGGLELALSEEVIHAFAQSKLSQAEVVEKVRQMEKHAPEMIRVWWQTYYAPAIQDGNMPATPPAKLSDAEAYHAGHEILRMMVQDAVFAGKVFDSLTPGADTVTTETVEALAGIVEWLKQALKTMGQTLKSALGKLEPAERASMQRVIEDIADLYQRAVESGQKISDLVYWQKQAAEAIERARVQADKAAMEPSFAKATEAKDEAEDDLADAADAYLDGPEVKASKGQEVKKPTGGTVAQSALVKRLNEIPDPEGAGNNIIVAIVRNGRITRPSKAYLQRQREQGGNTSFAEWDWMERTPIPFPFSNLVFKAGNGSTLNRAIQDLHERGYFPGTEAGDVTGDMVAAKILEVIDLYNAKKTGNDQDSQEQRYWDGLEEQALRFERATKSGPIDVHAASLQVGDVMMLKGPDGQPHRVEVINLDIQPATEEELADHLPNVWRGDDGSPVKLANVTLKDGTTFGVQTISGDERIYVDALTVKPGQEGQGLFDEASMAMLGDKGTKGLFEQGLGTRAMRGQQPVFYSRLAAAIEQADFGTTKPKQPMHWKGVIEKWARSWNSAAGSLWRKGIAAEELKWSGIMPWLDSQTGPITKQAVLDYLSNEGQVRLEEVRLGTPQVLSNGKPVAALTAAEQARLDELGPMNPADMSQAEQDEFEALNERAGLYEDTYGEQRTAEDPNRPKFGQYQLPGGKNYREVVLAMPEKANPSDIIVEQRNDPLNGNPWVAWAKTGNGQKAHQLAIGLNENQVRQQALAELSRSKGASYTSSNFPDVPNYVAHMRVNDRVDGEGRPGTFLEEIQSDRHQAGREKGYQGEFPTDVLEEAISNGASEAVARGHIKRLMERPTGDDASEGWQYLGRYVNKIDLNEVFHDRKNDAIPDAPFRKDWALQMFKRALAEAVGTGKQWIGWTTGETQAERYDLSKQVDRITVLEHAYAPGTYTVTARRNGDEVINKSANSQSEIADLIGKDLAKKAVADIEAAKLRPVPKYATTLEGLDLKVGGEGMKGFYDSILPKEIGKYVKQWGAGVVKGQLSSSAVEMAGNWQQFKRVFVRPRGSQWEIVGEYIEGGEIAPIDGQPLYSTKEAAEKAAGSKGTPIWRVDITPAMQAGMEAGQALFSRAMRGQGSLFGNEDLSMFGAGPLFPGTTQGGKAELFQAEGGGRRVESQKPVRTDEDMSREELLDHNVFTYLRRYYSDAEIVKIAETNALGRNILRGLKKDKLLPQGLFKTEERTDPETGEKIIRTPGFDTFENRWGVMSWELTEAVKDYEAAQTETTVSPDTLPAFSLESASPEQLRAEATRREQTAKIKDRQSAPLIGTQGDIGQMDMLGGGDLFASPAPRVDTPRQDAPVTAGPLESDRPRGTATDGGREAGVSADPGLFGADAGRVGADGEGSQNAEGNDRAADGGAAPAGRAGGAEPVQGTASRVSGSPAGSAEPRGSRGIDDKRAAVESGAELDLFGTAPERPATDEVAEERESTPSQRLVEQATVQNTAEGWDDIVPGDLENIARTLPILLPQQHDDVRKAENRWFNQQPTDEDPKKGMLFTNGTGTGKTFTGLGIIKRFEMMGRGRVLIVVPSQPKVTDWQNEGLRVMVKATALNNTTDVGKGVVVTTYANFRANSALQAEPWDLVVYDESHYLGGNAQGTQTENMGAHYRVTNKPGFYAQQKAERAVIGAPPDWSDKDAAKAYEAKKLEKAREIDEKLKNFPDTKAVFLSATPFSYHKSLGYADGYLFQSKRTDSTAYNVPQGMDRYLVENFGYTMKTNRLTSPPPEVDVGLMEREWSERQFQNGAMSGRMIDVPFDYSREFILLDSEVGRLLDEGFHDLAWGPSGESREESTRWEPLRRAFRNYWYGSAGGYSKRMQLLESIKIAAALERMNQHLDLGRKIVLFHSYNNAEPVHPFTLGYLGAPGDLTAEWRRLHPELVSMDFKRLFNPRALVSDEFGDRARFFNGEVASKERTAAVKAFNDDNSGVDIIMVQMDAGKEGISLHDVTGTGRQRVLMNAALPVKPTDAIQSEGRIYRIGVMSNAIQEYLTLHTAMERSAFGSKISERTGTVENMALGKMARTLKDSFKSGYLNAHSEAPSAEQGLGGKKQDAAELLGSDMDRAKSYYFSRQKKTSRNKAAEGVDYFATPEPVGLTMVRFLDAKAGMDLLEPSAGHGAIGRFFPDFTDNKYVEPSRTLSDELRIKVAAGKVEVMPFEDLHIVNKFDGVAMNPPFGTAGKMAMEHVAKAAKHLRQGGRLVALIPEGPAMEKRFEQWLYEGEGKDMHLRASYGLPTVTFERAGTSVKTRIVVLDKADLWEIRKEGDHSWLAYDSFGTKRISRQGDEATLRAMAKNMHDFIGFQGEVDLQGRSPRELSAETIGELFDQLENLSPPGRIVRDVATEAVTEDKETGRGGEGETQKTAPAAAPSNTSNATSSNTSNATSSNISNTGSPYAVAETLHAKKGTMTYVAKMERRLSDTEYRSELSRAKAAGGYYSAFKGSGAIPGFQFPSAAVRDAFVAGYGAGQVLGSRAMRGGNIPGEVWGRPLPPSGKTYEVVPNDKVPESQYKAFMEKHGLPILRATLSGNDWRNPAYEAGDILFGPHIQGDEESKQRYPLLESWRNLSDLALMDQPTLVKNMWRTPWMKEWFVQGRKNIIQGKAWAGVSKGYVPSRWQQGDDTYIYIYEGNLYRGESTPPTAEKILWLKSTEFPDEGIGRSGHSKSGLSASFYPRIAVQLSNGAVVSERVRISDHPQVSANAPRQYQIDLRPHPDQLSKRAFREIITQQQPKVFAGINSAVATEWHIQQNEKRQSTSLTGQAGESKRDMLGRGPSKTGAPNTTTPQDKRNLNSSVDQEAHEAATSPNNPLPEPTQAQKEAGNYKLGHVRISGHDISIENPAGSERKGTDPSGKAWSVTMQDHYGYFKGTNAKDGDHVDVFVKAGTPADYAGPVHIVRQVKPGTRQFDEYKVMLGYPTAEEARAAYLRNYAKGWQGLDKLTSHTQAEFQVIKDQVFTVPGPVREGDKVLASRAMRAEDKRMASTDGAAQANEPSPGGLSEAERLYQRLAEKYDEEIDPQPVSDFNADQSPITVDFAGRKWEISISNLRFRAEDTADEDNWYEADLDDELAITNDDSNGDVPGNIADIWEKAPKSWWDVPTVNANDPDTWDSSQPYYAVETNDGESGWMDDGSRMLDLKKAVQAYVSDPDENKRLVYYTGQTTRGKDRFGDWTDLPQLEVLAQPSFVEKLLRDFPGMTREEAIDIARTRNLDNTDTFLVAQAYARHNYTDYDDRLKNARELDENTDRERSKARFELRESIQAVMERWLTAPENKAPTKAILTTNGKADLGGDMHPGSPKESDPMPEGQMFGGTWPPNSDTPQDKRNLNSTLSARPMRFAPEMVADSLDAVGRVIAKTGNAMFVTLPVWTASTAANVGSAVVEKTGVQKPLAWLGSNRLDKWVYENWTNKWLWARARTGKDAVKAWLQKPGALNGVGKAIADNALPLWSVPREWLAMMHESQRKAAWGREKAMDVIRALSHSAKVSDLAYPKEFVENLAYRVQMFDAMEGKIPMSSLPKPLQDLAARLRGMLETTGRELVKQGLMNLDTFEELRDTGWMPRFTEDEAGETAGSWLKAFKLGIKDLKQQRSTAWHIVDTTRKEPDGQYVTVNRTEGAKRNRWRFRDQAQRDAFYEDFIRREAVRFLQEGGKDVTNMLAALKIDDKKSIRDEIGGLTRASIDLPAAMTEPMRNITKRAIELQRLRYKKEKPFEPDKLIKDPVYAVARYVMAQTHNAATAELMKETAKVKSWVSEVDTAGMTQIPDNPRFGPLAGKFVRDDIATQVLDVVNVDGAAMKFYDSMLRKWKGGKLVLNPGSHIRDAVGNTAFAYLGGNSLWNPGNWPHYRDAIATLRDGGAKFAELIEMQVLGGDAYTTQVKTALRGLLPDQKTVENADAGALMRMVMGLGAGARGTYEYLSALRSLPDDFYKTAAYNKYRAQGMDPQAAAAEVRKWFPYYDRLGTSTYWKVSGRFLNPFGSFFRESTRIMGRAAMERPMALSAVMLFATAVTRYSLMALGLGDDDEEAVFRAMRGKLKGGVMDAPVFSMLLPMRTSEGQLQQWDLSSVMPFADLIGTRVESREGEDEFTKFWRGLFTASPVLAAAWSASTNTDAFTGRKIVQDDMGVIESTGERLKNLAGDILPPLTPGVGVHAATLSNAGRRTGSLEMRNKYQSWIRAVLGMDVRSADPDLRKETAFFRKQNNLPVEGNTNTYTTPLKSRLAADIRGELIQDEPALDKIAEAMARLEASGNPIRTPKQMTDLLDSLDPTKLIKREFRTRLIASFSPEARRVFDNRQTEFKKSQVKAPGILAEIRRQKAAGNE